MPQFMIVSKANDGCFTSFADNYNEAKGKMLDLECGLGIYSELYERKETEERFFEYVFLEA